MVVALGSHKQSLIVSLLVSTMILAPGALAAPTEEPAGPLPLEVRILEPDAPVPVSHDQTCGGIAPLTNNCRFAHTLHSPLPALTLQPGIGYTGQLYVLIVGPTGAQVFACNIVGGIAINCASDGVGGFLAGQRVEVDGWTQSTISGVPPIGDWRVGLQY